MSTTTESSVTPEQQAKAHAADLKFLAEKMLEQANARNMGESFVSMVKEMNEKLSVKLPEPIRESKTYISVQFDIDTPEGVAGAGRTGGAAKFRELFPQDDLKTTLANLESLGAVPRRFDEYAYDVQNSSWSFPTETTEKDA